MKIFSVANFYTMKSMETLLQAWNYYKPEERRNIAIYLVGIILYRFGLEVFNGSIITLAIDRFSPENTFEKLGALTGINQAMQFFGAILIVQFPNGIADIQGPLVKSSSTQIVLSTVVLVFGAMTILLIITDRATGGRIKGSGDSMPTYGDYNPDILFPVFFISGFFLSLIMELKELGLFHGMVELVRRVIRRDLVNGQVQKLGNLDKLVFSSSLQLTKGSCLL
jgi:hypothetical protein